MSYRHAWGIIRKMNEAAGEDLVVSERGGKESGHTELTPAGVEVLREWEARRGFVNMAARYGPKPVLAVDAVLIRGAMVLLVRRKFEPHKGEWVLPGGFMAEGETAQEAVARELLEETGITSGVRGLVGVYSDPGRDPRHHTVSVAYLMEEGAGDPVGGDDAAEARFFPLDDLPPDSTMTTSWEPPLRWRRPTREDEVQPMTLTQPMVGLIASIVGIALPFIILYFALEGYDSRFKDKHLFFSIIVPLVVGTVISLFHISLSVSMLMFTMLPVVVLGLTVLEITAREVFLRANRFRGDPALPIYGLSTGLWFGAMIIFGRVYVHLMVREPDPMELGGICLFALTVAFVNGAMGMEAGSRPRNEWESLGVQFLVGGAFNLALGFFYIFLIFGVDAGVLVVMAIIAAAAFLVFTWERKRTITSRIPRDDESWGDYPGGPEGGDDMVAGRWTGDGKGGGVYDDGAVVDVTPASARSGAVGPKRRGGAGAGARSPGPSPAGSTGPTGGRAKVAA